jgi:hypothetical protein
MATSDVIGKGRHGSLAPVFIGDLSADVFANAPVELNDGRIDGDESTRPSGLDQPKHLVEVRLRCTLRL